MRGMALAGVLVGCGVMAAGAAVALTGLAGDFSDLDWRLRDAARQARVQIGLGAMLTGFAFVLAAQVLHRLDDTRDALWELVQATRRAAPVPAPAPPPKATVAGGWDSPGLPPRIEMVGRYGAEVGGRAWDLIRAAKRQGGALTEAEAVRAARQEIEGGQG